MPLRHRQAVRLRCSHRAHLLMSAPSYPLTALLNCPAITLFMGRPASHCPEAIRIDGLCKSHCSSDHIVVFNDNTIQQRCRKSHRNIDDGTLQIVTSRLASALLFPLQERGFADAQLPTLHSPTPPDMGNIKGFGRGHRRSSHRPEAGIEPADQAWEAPGARAARAMGSAQGDQPGMVNGVHARPARRRTPFPLLNMLDGFKHEGPCIEVDLPLPSWTAQHGIRIRRIQPGKPSPCRTP